jgi:hypothetical protein
VGSVGSSRWFVDIILFLNFINFLILFGSDSDWSVGVFNTLVLVFCHEVFGGWGVRVQRACRGRMLCVDVGWRSSKPGWERGMENCQAPYLFQTLSICNNFYRIIMMGH